MTVLLDAGNDSQIDWAVRWLRDEIPVALPTETVYGLAGRLGSERALARIFALKNRPRFDPLIVHVLDRAGAEKLVRSQEVPDLAWRLTEKFWPGPLTILFPKNKQVSDLCTNGSPFVALRSPAHPLFREVLARLQEPLAAPSANRFSRISPTSAQDVLEELGPYGLEAVLDGGRSERGIESTIVRVVSAQLVEVLRPGALSLERLREFLGTGVELRLQSSGGGVVAPGQMEVHYAPRTGVRFFRDGSVELTEALQTLSNADGFGARALLSVFRPRTTPLVTLPWRAQKILSVAGRDDEAAAELFAALRELDKLGVTEIWAVGASDEGLGRAINDRLRRASARLGTD